MSLKREEVVSSWKKNSSFRAFHIDINEVGHAFITLATGRKLWMFCKLCSLAKRLDEFARDRRHSFTHTISLIQGLSPTIARQISWVVLEAGCTAYFPHLYMHSVWTEIDKTSLSISWTCEIAALKDFYCSQKRLASMYLAMGRRCQSNPSTSSQ